MFSLLTPQVWAAYVSGLLSGVFAILAMVVSSRNERLRLRETAHREDVIWFRNAIAEAYSQSLYYLFKLSVSSASADRSAEKVRQHLSEAQRYLLLLHAYHVSSADRANIMQAVNALDDQQKELSESAREAVTLVRKLFQVDPRINVKK